MFSGLAETPAPLNWTSVQIDLVCIRTLVQTASRGVEQWQLASLTCWRSVVRFHSPLPQGSALRALSLMHQTGGAGLSLKLQLLHPHWAKSACWAWLCSSAWLPIDTCAIYRARPSQSRTENGTAKVPFSLSDNPGRSTFRISRRLRIIEGHASGPLSGQTSLACPADR